MKSGTKGMVVLLGCVFLGACQMYRGHDGRDGANGSNGANGQTGLQGPPGLGGAVPFTYEGQYSFPTVTVTQVIPGLSLERGDILNVYIQWQGQPWTQIGSTWIGGMAGYYSVSGNTVTIATVIGPQFPLITWLINGVKSS